MCQYCSPLVYPAGPWGGRGADKKVKKLAVHKTKAPHFRSQNNDTSPQINEVFRPRRKGSPGLLDQGMTMSFQTQGARAAKLKSMKLQASKWETIFPATSDILNLPPSFIWLHRLVCRCSELNWQTDIVKTHCQWITLGRSDWSICESPRGDQKLTALAFLATYLLTKI